MKNARYSMLVRPLNKRTAAERGASAAAWCSVVTRYVLLPMSLRITAEWAAWRVTHHLTAATSLLEVRNAQIVAANSTTATATTIMLIEPSELVML